MLKPREHALLVSFTVDEWEVPHLLGQESCLFKVKIVVEF